MTWARRAPSGETSALLVREGHEFDAEASLVEVATEHARSLDAQIRVVQLQRAVLRGSMRSWGPSCHV